MTRFRIYSNLCTSLNINALKRSTKRLLICCFLIVKAFPNIIHLFPQHHLWIKNFMFDGMVSYNFQKKMITFSNHIFFEYVVGIQFKLWIRCVTVWKTQLFYHSTIQGGYISYCVQWINLYFRFKKTQNKWLYFWSYILRHFAWFLQWFFRNSTHI